MGIKYSFVDSTVYGAEDINDITRSIIGAGVAPFVSKSSYNVSDLNAMTKVLVEAGTQLNGCKCTVKNAGVSGMSVEIAPGIVFFESGVRLEIDADGYVIAIEPNTEGYIFANYRPALQKAELAFDTQLPDDGETIVLAQIFKNGTLRDIRTFARSKIASVGTNVLVEKVFEKLDEPVLYNGRYITAKIPGVDLTRFNFAILVASPYYGGNPIYFPSLGISTAIYNIKNANTDHVIYRGETIRSDLKYFFSSANYTYFLETINGELCIVCQCEEKYKKWAIDNTLVCSVCLV